MNTNAEHRACAGSRRSRRWLAAAVILSAVAVAAASPAHAAAPPSKPSQPVPSPGKAVAAGDDTSAITQNPANLAFMPSPELRWTWAFTGSSSPLALRGHAVAAAVPLWLLATGLRVDALDPPSAAPPPLDRPHQWVRWSFSARAGSSLALGSTLAWSFSKSSRLDDLFSITTGVTYRPATWLSLSAVARDWNEPTAASGASVERSYDFGLAVRPIFGRRDLEIGLETAFYERSKAWVPRATIGVDVPRVGRLRGDVSMFDPGGSPSFAAMAGLDVGLSFLELSAGSVFGDAITPSGTGFYAGVALHPRREPGVRLPAQFVRVRIDTTPGVRGHVRLLRRLWAMARDPEVEGVVLVVRAEPAGSLAHAEEVGDAVRMLRAAGKKVLCHLEDAGGRSLFVCSQADRIAMNPAGGFRFAGLSSRYFYFGSLLKKLGVRADFVRIGKHKLAVEQFTTADGSPIGALDHQDLIDQYESVYLHDIGGGRHIPEAELKKRIATGPFLAGEARNAGLVDVLAFEDEIDRVVEEMAGRRARVVEPSALEQAPTWWANPSKIAVVYLSGDMIDGESQNIPFVGITLAGSNTIARALRRAREDPTIRAVVFRIETGGGSSLAADVILREAILTAKAKPLIVSMGTHAASGGYYASVSGGRIYANRATVTGSIGIFYGKVDVVGLLEKFGVGIESFRSAPRADAESLFRPFTDDERQQLGIKVKQFYDLFIARVAEGRHMTPAQVDAVARGRVWTGAQAKERGLVDTLGGLREALAEARSLAALPLDAPIVELPEEDDSLLGMLLGLAGVSAAGVQAPAVPAVIPPALAGLARSLAPFFVFESNKPLAHIEYVDDIAFGGSP